MIADAILIVITWYTLHRQNKLRATLRMKTFTEVLLRDGERQYTYVVRVLLRLHFCFQALSTLRMSSLQIIYRELGHLKHLQVFS